MAKNFSRGGKDGLAIPFYRVLLPFQDNAKGDHTFVEDTSFDDVRELYIFDKKLRIHILDALEEIEVAFRATVSDMMSLAYGAQWYLDKRHFGNRYGRKRDRPFDHEKLLREINDTDSVPLRHYRRTYTDPIHPPSWMMIASLSYGLTQSIVFFGYTIIIVFALYIPNTYRFFIRKKNIFLSFSYLHPEFRIV